MKKIAFTALAVLLLSTTGANAIDAHGSAFGAMWTARTIGAGNGQFQAGVGIADATSAWGAFTYGLSPYVDGRIKLGLIDYDQLDTKFTFGADLKWNVLMVQAESTDPLDLAVGAQFEFVDYDGFSVLQLGGNIIGSYPFLLRNGTTLAPYGRLNIRVESYSYDNDAFDGSSDMEFGFNGGVMWEASPTITLHGEFQFDGNDGIFLGIDFSVI